MVALAEIAWVPASAGWGSLPRGGRGVWLREGCAGWEGASGLPVTPAVRGA